MIVYRLCNAAHATLDGEGARRFGGRWNSPGRPMVYAAASPSLAVLEVMVHLDLPANLLPDDYRLLTISVPDDAHAIRLDPMPKDSNECRKAGDGFLKSGNALFMLVRSVVVQQEWNTLLNVNRVEMRRVHILSNEPFAFDPRLFATDP